MPTSTPDTIMPPDPDQRSVRAVLFDLDGTLVETTIDFPLMRRETLAVAARYGGPPADPQRQDALAVIDQTAAGLSDPAPFLSEVEAVLQAIELTACVGARPTPGALELLAWLAEQEVCVGIVTRNCREAAVESLRRAGLDCGLLLTRADVPRVKPDPLHLLIAAERLGVPAATTLMVGDHPMDILGGRAAGMRTAGFGPTEEARARLAAAQPDFMVSDLNELRAWISTSSS